jgi:excisionase family DNA binding protein
MSDEVLLTVDEAARRLGMGRTYTYTLVLRGELASVKLGRSRRVPVQALQEYVGRLGSDADEAGCAGG